MKDENGEISEIHCTYFPETKSGLPSDKKVKGTIHWVNPKDAIEAEVRLYDRLFSVEKPEDVEEGEDFRVNLNPDSLTVVKAFAEPTIKDSTSGQSYQFERNGYFVIDPDTKPGKMVLNRTVTLKDSWAKAR